MAKKIPNPVDKHVGSRVRMARLSLGKSQEWLGDQVGLTFQQIQKYEKGTNRIGSSRLMQFQVALQKPAAWFFEGAPGLDGVGLTPTPTDEYAAAMLSDRAGVRLVSVFHKLKPDERTALVDFVSSMTEGR